MRIGVVGGSFNPPHVGHAALIQYALAVGDFDQVLVAPCYKHPFKDNLLPFNNRIEMCKLMVSKLLPKEKVIVVDYERDLDTGYTYDLVYLLNDSWPEDHYTLILGEDLKREFDERWHRSEDIKTLVDFLWVPTHLYASNPVIQVRSSYIRMLIKEGRDVRHLVPKCVLDYLVGQGFMKKLGEME